MHAHAHAHRQRHTGPSKNQCVPMGSSSGYLRDVGNYLGGRARPARSSISRAWARARALKVQICTSSHRLRLGRRADLSEVTTRSGGSRRNTERLHVGTSRIGSAAKSRRQNKGGEYSLSPRPEGPLLGPSPPEEASGRPWATPHHQRHSLASCPRRHAQGQTHIQAALPPQRRAGRSAPTAQVPCASKRRRAQCSGGRAADFREQAHSEVLLPVRGRCSQSVGPARDLRLAQIRRDWHRCSSDSEPRAPMSVRTSDPRP